MVNCFAVANKFMRVFFLYAVSIVLLLCFQVFSILLKDSLSLLRHPTTLFCAVTAQKSDLLYFLLLGSSSKSKRYIILFYSFTSPFFA